MSPSEDRKNGDTTEHEQQRNQPIGSNAKAVRETDESKRSRKNAEFEHATSEATFEKLPETRCKRFDLKTSGKKKQQLFDRRGEEKSVGFIEKQIQGFWTNVGAREVGGERETKDIRRKYPKDHDRRRHVEVA